MSEKPLQHWCDAEFIEQKDGEQVAVHHEKNAPYLYSKGCWAAFLSLRSSCLGPNNTQQITALLYQECLNSISYQTFGEDVSRSKELALCFQVRSYDEVWSAGGNGSPSPLLPSQMKLQAFSYQCVQGTSPTQERANENIQAKQNNRFESLD